MEWGEPGHEDRLQACWAWQGARRILLIVQRGRQKAWKCPWDPQLEYLRSLRYVQRRVRYMGVAEVPELSWQSLSQKLVTQIWQKSVPENRSSDQHLAESQASSDFGHLKVAREDL